jgi:cell division protein YceG involved in septum cleavage
MRPRSSTACAARSPTASDFLFYLSARDGRTIFSRTLDEHNRAKAQHLGRCGAHLFLTGFFPLR